MEILMGASETDKDRNIKIFQHEVTGQKEGLQHYHSAHLCDLCLVDFSGPGIGSENADFKTDLGLLFFFWVQ